MSRRGPLATLLAGAVVAAVLVALSLRGGGTAGPPASSAGAAQAAAGLSAPLSPPASPAAPTSRATPTRPATPTRSAPLPRPAPVNGSWAGRIEGAPTTLAIAVTNGTAVAYLCDGRKVEAWMRGTAIGDLLTLKAVKGGGRLTGTLRSDRARGTVTAADRERGFDIASVRAPSGLYRATANVRGAAVVGGWIVLADGSQVGLATAAGRPVRPSMLDVAARTATVTGGTVHAARLGGDG